MKRIFAFIIAVVLFADIAGFNCFCADTVTLHIESEYNYESKMLCVTLSAENKNTDISSGFIALCYDYSVLVPAQKECFKANDGLSVMLNGSDTEKSCVWLDFYTLSSIKKSQSKTEIAKAYFKLASGAGVGEISDTSVVLCTDRDFLNSIAGYGSDGGALFCSGNNCYSLFNGEVAVKYKYINAEQSENADEEQPAVSDEDKAEENNEMQQISSVTNEQTADTTTDSTGITDDQALNEYYGENTQANKNIDGVIASYSAKKSRARTYATCVVAVILAAAAVAVRFYEKRTEKN